MDSRLGAMITGMSGDGRAGLALLLVGLWSLPGLSQINPDDLLPVEEAFALEASVDGDSLILHWDIADDYYLYRHAFDVAASGQGTLLGDPLIPPGAPQVDEFFGETETYRNAVTVRVPLEDPPANAMVQASVAFQGCADVGVCYPPH